MKILVVGSGGREHALVWKLAQSPHVTEMWCAPGNAGTSSERLHLRMGRLVENVALHASDVDGLCIFAAEKRIGLVVVGPDEPLALGLVDRLQTLGIRTFGPTRAGARFESSKVFTQEFCVANQIPIVEGEAFSKAGNALRYAQELDGVCVVKADGLARGKGVILCYTVDEAKDAIDQMLGVDGDKEVVIQHLVEGWEASFHYLCDGRTMVPFPPTKDYKRRDDHDRGPNTGGMGACFPHRLVKDEMRDRFRREVANQWLSACISQDIDYRGILYPGMIVGSDGKPRLLEFNCRFGDPEAQVYMRMLEMDLLELLLASVGGKIVSHDGKLRGPFWRPGYCVCVVITSENYPESESRGVPIEGLDEVEKIPVPHRVKVFHSGTVTRSDGRIYTNGGRILSVTATGYSLEIARERAYEAVKLIRFPGMRYREDIGCDLYPFYASLFPEA